MATRDQLRSAAFKDVPRKRKTISINGQEFELLQPLVKDRTEFVKKGEQDSMAMLIQAVISMTVVPGTTEPVFEDSDYELFNNQTVGGFLDQVSEELLEFMNLEVNEKKD